MARKTKEAEPLYSVISSDKKIIETCLSEFINTLSKQYTPLERRGIPRSDKKGFPQKKYDLSLFLMMNLTKKRIAEELGISYSLTRKWASEKDVKNMTRKHCRDFAVVFFNYWFEEAKDFQERRDKYSEKQSKGSHPVIDFSVIVDANLYSYQLVNEIIKIYNKKRNDFNLQSDVEIEVDYIIRTVLSTVSDHLQEFDNSSFLVLPNLQLYALGAVKDIQQILSKCKLSGKDQAKLDFSLGRILELLGFLNEP